MNESSYYENNKNVNAISKMNCFSDVFLKSILKGTEFNKNIFFALHIEYDILYMLVFGIGSLQ